MRLCRVIVLASLVIAFASCRDFNSGEKKPEPVDHTPINQPDLPAGQVNGNYAKIDVSPMDMSYFPVDYPKLKMTNKDQPAPLARVIYSRPHLGKRKITDIIKPGKPWRMGANESTEIQFYRAATINGTRVNPGRYILYCIPDSTKWSIVFNSNIDTWGLEQDPSKDIHRFTVDATNGHPSLEYFTIEFEKSKEGADMVVGWDDIVARLPIRF